MAQECTPDVTSHLLCSECRTHYWAVKVFIANYVCLPEMNTVKVQNPQVIWYKPEYKRAAQEQVVGAEIAGDLNSQFLEGQRRPNQFQ